MLGILAGPGVGEALVGAAVTEELVLDTPFGSPSSHVRIVRVGESRVAVLARHGDENDIPPSRVPSRANVYALKQVGVTHVLAFDEVRSLRDEIRPGDLVIADQVIDRTTRRATTFFDEGISVHVEMARPYCESLRARALGTTGVSTRSVHPRGTYVCVEGPSWSTAAEAHMHRLVGGDILGQTAMPEARVAREAELCAALVCYVVADCEGWRVSTKVDATSVPDSKRENDRRVATGAAMALLAATAEDLHDHPPGSCSCHDALSRAVATSPGAIRPETRARYGVLLARFLAEVGEDR